MRKCKSCGEPLPPRPPGKRGPKRQYCNKVTCNSQYREKRKNGKTFTFTRMIHGWTKYGGGNKTPAKRPDDIWYCQICGRKQTPDMGAYIVPFNASGREYGLMCAQCKNKAVRNDIVYYKKIRKLVKRVVYTA